MLSYLCQLQIPLAIYSIILGEEPYENDKEKDKDTKEKDKKSKERPFIVRREVEKCLKFIYQYAKTCKSRVPKIYCYLIKNLLLEFCPCPYELMIYW
jgi:hypothetical protein